VTTILPSSVPEQSAAPSKIADPMAGGPGAVNRIYGIMRSVPVWVLWLLVVVWSIPTLGLLINSFRPRDLQRSTAGGESRVSSTS
jgi:hypothetical protein